MEDTCAVRSSAAPHIPRVAIANAQASLTLAEASASQGQSPDCGQGRTIPIAVPAKGSIMPKAKPISLHPLTFHEAFKAIVGVDPDSVGIISKRRKSKPKAKSSSKSKGRQSG